MDPEKGDMEEELDAINAEGLRGVIYERVAVVISFWFGFGKEDTQSHEIGLGSIVVGWWKGKAHIHWPLRLITSSASAQCASRRKPTDYWKNITDRKERIDPPLPAALSQPSYSASPVQMRSNATARPKINCTTYAHKPSPSFTVTQTLEPFANSPALDRTLHGMAAFRALESEAGPSSIPNGYSPSSSTTNYDSEADEALIMTRGRNAGCKPYLFVPLPIHPLYSDWQILNAVLLRLFDVETVHLIVLVNAYV
ncbi:hypothetical protein BDR05DRAFT_1005879 [Suillus weaverae]|nr:hypothetical protein BDR05DRAFT_1005879 [Suillus weaverae]